MANFDFKIEGIFYEIKSHNKKIYKDAIKKEGSLRSPPFKATKNLLQYSQYIGFSVQCRNTLQHC